MTLENDAEQSASAGADAPTIPDGNGSDLATPPAKTDAPYTDEAFTDDLTQIWDKHNQARGEDGKFSSTKPAETAPEGEQVSSDQSPTDKQAEPETAIGMPQSWSADRKATWDQLPSAAKEIIAQREQEAHKTISKQGEQIKAIEPIRSVFDQYRDQFEGHGVDEVTGVSRLLEASRKLDHDPSGGIAWLAQAYGVDLRKLAGLQPSGNVSPDVAAILERSAFLERQIQELNSRVEGREKAEAETQFKTTENLIAEFAKDKTDWTDLESDIHGEILGLKASINAGVKPEMSPQDILKTAYERAQRNNPDAWAKKQERERQAEEKKKIEEAKKRAADARRSSPLNVKSSVANVPTGKTWEEDLEEIARKAYG